MMNFMKRALLSTSFKKGRTFLLILVFSAILIFILAGLTIQNAALKAIDNASKSTGATVTLSTNIRNAFTSRDDNSAESNGENSRPEPGSFQVTPVDLDLAEQLADLDNVSSVNYLSTTYAFAESFEPITSSDTSTDETSDTNSFGGMSGGMRGTMAQGDVSIEGISSTDTLSDFSDGTNEIVDGVGLTEEDAGSNSAVIEQNLAEANDLSVGDTIEITSTDEETTIELQIVGIYETTATVDSRMMQFSVMNPSNTIYTSYTVANSLKGDDYANTIDSAVYTLSDPEKTADFVESAESLGLDTETYTLQTNDSTYQQMLQPLNNIGEFAENIIILVTAAGVVILSLIVILMVRERKHEIGVLLSLGEKRTKIVSQFFVEMLIVLIVAIGVSGVSGKYVGNVIGEQLINQQTETATTGEIQQTDGTFDRGSRSGLQGGFQSFRNFGASSTEIAEQIDDLNITVTLDDLFELGGYGLAISFISIVIASVGILRMQPKKILIS
ncbi:ABC transporter permease [Fervidibacillus albus]|uniref:ABC transporter permease n=1 Tax=Fervidibacillus albus TaxID=2980026 RepID=A0A9E8LS45_9BACI|nr:ABC transporter permease [Fervidibacillus albus]WAA08584.1 ABC transporter permease [Fervidibacillus albus]